MVPKREWVRRWVQLREQLSAQVDFDRYFAEGEVGGHAVSVLRAGLCPVPSGELLVGDPFGGLQNRGELPYFVTAPVGDYPLELSVAQTDDGRPVYAAARLRFNYRRAVSFEQALTGKEDLGSFDGGYYGFWADSGWACLCDKKAHRAFCDFAQSATRRGICTPIILPRCSPKMRAASRSISPRRAAGSTGPSRAAGSGRCCSAPAGGKETTRLSGAWTRRAASASWWSG